MKQKYKYLKLLDKSLLNLILEHSELEENEYKVVRNTLITEDLIEKQCTNLSISNSTYRNLQDTGLAKVHLTFCFVIRNALKN
jgi:predicted metal-binding transcription factor (methanogenesis marker protein 9)